MHEIPLNSSRKNRGFVLFLMSMEFMNFCRSFSTNFSPTDLIRNREFSRFDSRSRDSLIPAQVWAGIRPRGTNSRCLVGLHLQVCTDCQCSKLANGKHVKRKKPQVAAALKCISFEVVITCTHYQPKIFNPKTLLYLLTNLLLNI